MSKSIYEGLWASLSVLPGCLLAYRRVIMSCLVALLASLQLSCHGNTYSLPITGPLIVLTKGATFAVASTCFRTISMTQPNSSVNDSICSKGAMRVNDCETWPTDYCSRSSITRQIQSTANWAIWGDRNQLHQSCVCTWWPRKAESLYLPVHMSSIKSSTPWNYQWSDSWMLSPSIWSIQQQEVSAKRLLSDNTSAYFLAAEELKKLFLPHS